MGIKLDISGQLKKDLETHKAESMPHQFTDESNSKTYKYGLKAQNGELIFIYEEVV